MSTSTNPVCYLVKLPHSVSLTRYPKGREIISGPYLMYNIGNKWVVSTEAKAAKVAYMKLNNTPKKKQFSAYKSLEDMAFDSALSSQKVRQRRVKFV